jgi:putative hydrolase of the HAD superfamily
LILDYGEVLSLPQHPDAIATMAATLGAPADAFAVAYWRHRRAYDLGLPASEYWQRVANDLSSDGNAPVADLIAADVASWMTFREEMWQLAATARATGIRTAVLSNGIREVLARLDVDRPLANHFDIVVISYEVGCVKPDPRIYLITLDRLGVAPANALFVDDRAENIDGARRLGIDTFHFTGPNRFEELTRRIGGSGGKRTAVASLTVQLAV